MHHGHCKMFVKLSLSLRLRLCLCLGFFQATRIYMPGYHRQDNQWRGAIKLLRRRGHGDGRRSRRRRAHAVSVQLCPDQQNHERSHQEEEEEPAGSRRSKQEYTGFAPFISQLQGIKIYNSFASENIQTYSQRIFN